ncbi:MAG: hypothetical protein ACXQS8_01835 [Candidatus Helarchaeales archaeon]
MIPADIIIPLALDSTQYQNMYYAVLSLAFLGIVLLVAYLLVGKEREEED